MKAFCVTEKSGACDSALIVFAETRGQAIRYALDYTGVFDWSRWVDMRANRVPKLDAFYKGKPEMDWYDEKERTAMVRYAGMRCSDEVDVTLDKCRACAAHEWCARYEWMTE